MKSNVSKNTTTWRGHGRTAWTRVLGVDVGARRGHGYTAWGTQLGGSCVGEVALETYMTLRASVAPMHVMKNFFKLISIPVSFMNKCTLTPPPPKLQLVSNAFLNFSKKA